MNLAALLVLYVAVFISLFIGCITFLKNKESYTNRLFFALILNLVVWLVLSFQTVTIQNADLTNRVRAILILAVLQVAIHFLLIFTYPYSCLQLTYRQSLTYIVLSCTILALTVSPLTLKSVYVGSGDQIHIEAGYGMILFVGYVLATIFTGFVKLIKSLKSNKGIERSQTKVLLLGALILWIIVPATNFFIPLLFSSKYFNGMFSELFVVTYILLISFGITQSKLFNIRKAILRSALSSLLSASGLLFYSLFVSVVFVIAKNKNFRFDQLLFVCSAILVVVLTLPLFKKYFNNVTDKYLYKNSYNPQSVLGALMEVSRRHLEMDALLHKSLSCLSAALNPTESLLVAFDKKEVLAFAGNGKGIFEKAGFAKELYSILEVSDELFYFEDIAPADTSITKKLNDMEISVAISLVHEHRCVGVLVFGCKQNGQSYTAKDIELLRLSAHTLSLAIQNSVQYETIKRTAENLQTEVALATKQISRKNKKLRQLIQSKDEFVSMASHQLLPQITGSKGLIETLPKHDEVLTMIHSSLGRMEMLVHDMLNVGRLRNGNLMLHRTTFNLVQTVYAEIRSLEYFAKKSSVHITFEHEETVMDIKADEDKLREVVFNLIENAIAYSDTGSKVTINLFKRGSGYVFEIQDKGIGISPKEISKIFDIFYRSDVAKQKRPTGTGIGLYVSKKILDAHQYPLEVSSGQGKGTKIAIMMTQDIEVKKRQE